VSYGAFPDHGNPEKKLGGAFHLLMRGSDIVYLTPERLHCDDLERQTVCASAPKARSIPWPEPFTMGLRDDRLHEELQTRVEFLRRELTFKIEDTSNQLRESLESACTAIDERIGALQGSLENDISNLEVM
jgi:hypothetical protein